MAPGSGEVGLLAITPPIPIGYFRDPAKSAETFRTIGDQRYAIPGDLARLEADGTVSFLGRGSLCINTGGEKVYPEETEEAVRAHPAVLDANVVGVPDEQWGEAVTAVVSLVPGSTATDEEIRAAVRERLAAYKVPKRVVFVRDIPRSPSGKPLYDWARGVAREAATAATGSRS
jgi:acyl-CoA synthetase (AMP-forming)/AMP-acid ligase II